MEKRILLASPRGFCMGVERAVRMLEEALRREQGTVYVRRELVHNAALMERFQSLGAVVVREVDQVPPGGTVVFSAHGVAPSPALNGFLTRHGTTPVSDGAPLAALLRRPQVRYRDLRQFDPDMPDLPAEVAEQVEISVKYEGYIRRQMEEVEEGLRTLKIDFVFLGAEKTLGNAPARRADRFGRRAFPRHAGPQSPAGPVHAAADGHLRRNRHGRFGPHRRRHAG